MPLAAPAIPLEPRSYTPRHLADKILASRSALRGERKLVTVLFADVAGSMELAERVDPEEWHRLLDRLFRILADGVHRYEGTINQYTGDGIMAEHRYHERPSPRAPPPRAPLPLTSRPPPRAGFPLEPQAQPPIHGDARVPLPSLTEFLALLLARQRLFELRLYEREPPTHAERDAPLRWLYQQLFVAPDTAKGRQLASLARDAITERQGRWALSWEPMSLGVVTWRPRAAG